MSPIVFFLPRFSCKKNVHYLQNRFKVNSFANSRIHTWSCNIFKRTIKKNETSVKTKHPITFHIHVGNLWQNIFDPKSRDRFDFYSTSGRCAHTIWHRTMVKTLEEKKRNIFVDEFTFNFRIYCWRNILHII